MRILLGFLLAVAAIFFAQGPWISMDDLFLIDKTRSWSRTQGTVTKADINVIADKNFQVFKQDAAAPNLVVSYSASGEQLTSTRPWIGADHIAYSLSRDVIGPSITYKGQLLADYISDNYKPQQRVEVFFDPYEPTNAVLEHTDNAWQLYAGLFLRLALVVGLLFYAASTAGAWVLVLAAVGHFALTL
ncbi:MAG: DUF3592 domain-containing protein [Gammaproteobacteria bacterium]|nr:DUF3592 domain-containing protein [Gammaproteobacteria bacterium]